MVVHVMVPHGAVPGGDAPSRLHHDDGLKMAVKHAQRLTGQKHGRNVEMGHW